jgi:membrane-associated phospholipid phosphatase
MFNGGVVQNEEDESEERAMSNRTKRIRTVVCQGGIIVGLLLSAPAQASKKGWDDATTVAVYGLDAVAIGLPLVKDDTPGALQAAGSIGATQLVAFGLKEAFPEWRPDRSDRKSFPSGHTSSAFAAASTLFNREGPAVGIPALAIATFVGVGRVEADKHHWYDVVAGAGIGATAGFLITRDRRDKVVMLTPWGDSKGGGISFAMRF